MVAIWILSFIKFQLSEIARHCEVTARYCEVDGMCNLSQVIYDRGYRKGFLDSIRNLMETTCWDIEKCMDILNIPEERKDYYRNKIIGIVSS